jgi:hypothetical protein
MLSSHVIPQPDLISVISIFSLHTMDSLIQKWHFYSRSLASFCQYAICSKFLYTILNSLPVRRWNVGKLPSKFSLVLLTRLALHTTFIYKSSMPSVLIAPLHCFVSLPSRKQAKKVGGRDNKQYTRHSKIWVTLYKNHWNMISEVGNAHMHHGFAT